MLFRSVFVDQKPASSGLTVLLATAERLLIAELQPSFTALGLRVEVVTDGEAVIAATRTLEDSAVILLDIRLAAVANGRLLAALEETGIHKRCAIALIAESVADEWIGRLREGLIDDIVPRNADEAAWGTHLRMMRRGHQLLCELEQLREASLLEVQHDVVTGAFNRGTMLTLLFRETDRVQRLHGSLCLVLFAIDDFAYWSRELGRDACDWLLREVVTRTGRILRSYDLLGRVGKDELLLALPGCSTINAAMMAERLRAEVLGEPFLVPDGSREEPGEAVPVKLTACFGVTSSRGRSPIVVLREAEKTLALSRKLGPDSIHCTREAPLSAASSAGVPALFPDGGATA